MKTDTIIRTLVLVLALVNQVLAVFGMSPLPIEEAELEALLSTLFTVGASLWAWWKNNSFTKKAIEADNYLVTLKSE